MDLYSDIKRSEIMSKIGSKNTKLEIVVRRILFANGFRFRINDKRYPGKPDIVLPKYKTVIFVNGCFWHGHSCPAAKLPSTRLDFWKNKININKKRDEINSKKLKDLGFEVVTIWQCELKNKQLIEHTLSGFMNQLK